MGSAGVSMDALLGMDASLNVNRLDFGAVDVLDFEANLSAWQEGVYPAQAVPAIVSIWPAP